MEKNISANWLGFGLLLFVAMVVTVTIAFSNLGRDGSQKVTAKDAPFDIKTNQELGIALGDDPSQRKAFANTDCVGPNDHDPSTSCFLTLRDGVTVAGADAGLCVVRYYNGKVIQISYSLHSDDWPVTMAAFKDKFGSGTNDEGSTTWRNSISSMRLSKPSADGDSTLDMDLSLEISDWLKESHKLEQQKAKDSL